jgi:putative sterol carrier protein
VEYRENKFRRSRTHILKILVDILQEWDRYTTSRNSVFTGELPVSSTDINIGSSNGVVHINYGTGKVAEKAAEKIKEVLGKSLDGWEDIVRVSYSK